MDNSKKTRKALLASIMALALCFVMLIGTTFAWFSDNSSTAINKIIAGKLDIELQMKDGENWVSAEGKTLNFVKADGTPATEAILWEPGCTYSLPTLRVINKGNLALKYKFAISGINGDAALNEVIDWTLDNADVTAEYHLAAGATSEDISISGHMQETAGNEYQGLTIDGISITLYATQDTVEHDSYDEFYDRNATYDIPPVPYEGKVANDGTVSLTAGACVVNVSNGTPGEMLKLIVSEYSAPHATVSVAFDEAYKSFDIKVVNADTEVAPTNGTYQVVLQLPTGLRMVKGYHDGVLMTASDNSFAYDDTTGVATFTVAHFSQFDFLYASETIVVTPENFSDVVALTGANTGKGFNAPDRTFLFRGTFGDVELMTGQYPSGSVAYASVFDGSEATFTSLKITTNTDNGTSVGDSNGLGTFKNFTVSGKITVLGYAATLVENCSAKEMEVNAYNGSKATIKNCTVTGAANNGILLKNGGGSVYEVIGCTVKNVGKNCVQIYGGGWNTGVGGTYTISGNTFENWGTVDNPKTKAAVKIYSECVIAPNPGETYNGGYAYGDQKAVTAEGRKFIEAVYESNTFNSNDAPCVEVTTYFDKTEFAVTESNYKSVATATKN